MAKNEKLIKKVTQISHHRNGISGAPFYAVLFESTSGEKFVATVFDEPYSVAVLRVPDLSDIDKGVTFGINSWRGDNYEPELRSAIKKWEDKR